jgi:lysine-specific histone demethylase 1
MGGDHCLLPGGNSRLVAALCTGVPIFYNCRVEHIAHGTSGAVVTCMFDDGGGTPRKREFRADSALVTLPLGVLKREAVTFEPPLPPRKLSAIRALGWGTLNKCVMLFPEPFWETGLDTFGRVAETQGARGELFLFYSYVHLCGAAGAVLIGLVAGEAAESFESVDSAEAQRRCVEALQSIFGPRGVDVPQPVAFVRTAWAGDPYARGSYSNVQVGASGDDYDEMASPVGDHLFFAGEATCRTHPATMHGAFFSGLREAARIADWRPSGGAATHTEMHTEDAATTTFEVVYQPQVRSDFNPEVVQRHLVAAFTHADWEFGSFALVLHPTDESPEAPALVRVDLSRALDVGASKRTLPVFLRLRRGDALALRDCPGGDAERLALLSGMKGGGLSGRKQDLGADAFALAALRASCCMAS